MIKECIKFNRMKEVTYLSMETERLASTFEANRRMHEYILINA